MLKYLFLIFIVVVSGHFCQLFAGVKRFIDKEGDEIIILDQGQRQRVSKQLNKAATNVYEDEIMPDQFKNNFKERSSREDRENYGYQLIQKGDTFKSLSKKLYGDIQFEFDLQLLNEEEFPNNRLVPGKKLKYLKHPKVPINGGSL
jgi:hypothetical protein